MDQVTAVTDVPATALANWKVSQPIDWGTCSHDVTHGECSKSYDTSPFSQRSIILAGDEDLQINVTITNAHPVRDDMGHTFTWLAAAETYGVEDEWGAGPLDPNGGCNFVLEGPGDHNWILGSYSEWAPTLGYWHDWDWSVNFNICGGEFPRE